MFKKTLLNYQNITIKAKVMILVKIIYKQTVPCNLSFILNL